MSQIYIFEKETRDRLELVMNEYLHHNLREFKIIKVHVNPCLNTEGKIVWWYGYIVYDY